VTSTKARRLLPEEQDVCTCGSTFAWHSRLKTDNWYCRIAGSKCRNFTPVLRNSREAPTAELADCVLCEGKGHQRGKRCGVCAGTGKVIV
jgi:hypothetical protein